MVYISLELSENLISLRLDAMTAGRSTKEVMRNMEDSALKVSLKGKSSGNYRVIQMQSSITVNDIYSFLREYEIESGEKVDAVIVDYLDLMMPTNKNINVSDTFLKDKFISEELRNLAIDLKILFCTASQFNRSAVDESTYDHSHIAGGISKINSADNVIGIYTSNALKENGKYQIQFLKTRSSNGVGQVIDLKFDQNTLRISNAEETTSPFMGDISRKSTVTDKKTSMLDMAKFMKNTDL